MRRQEIPRHGQAPLIRASADQRAAALASPHAETQIQNFGNLEASEHESESNRDRDPMLAWPLIAAASAGAAAVGVRAMDASPSPLSCFVEYPSSSTVKNMCERQFDQLPNVTDVESCAAVCVAEPTCVMFAWASVAPVCRLSATCKAPTNALPGYDGYFRNSSSGPACSPAAPTPPPPGNSTPLLAPVHARWIEEGCGPACHLASTVGPLFPFHVFS